MLAFLYQVNEKAILYLSYPARNASHDQLELSSFLKNISFVSSLEKQDPKLDISFIKTLSELLKRPTPILDPSTYSLNSFLCFLINFRADIYNDNISVDNTFCSFYSEENKSTEGTKDLKYSSDGTSISQGQLDPKYGGFINLKTVLYNQVQSSERRARQSQAQSAQSAHPAQTMEKPTVKRLGIRRSMPKRTLFYGK